MITPLIPVLILGPLGGTALMVGLVEGLAELAAQALKPLAGRCADRDGRHARWALGGYLVSNLARPLIGWAPGWPWALGLRTLDRVGKGLRTAPRDALLAEAAPAGQRAEAFGYHRSMDHLGAALGPVLGAALLALDRPLAEVFLWSAVPGLLTVLLLARLGLPRIAPTSAEASRARPLDAEGRRLVLAAGVLGFAHLPEAFMVVWAHQAGWTLLEIAALWAAVHALKVAVAWPAGALADAFGHRRVVLAGWWARAAALASGALLAEHASALALGAVFAGYGVALALSEGAERALIAAAAAPGRRGAAFGWYAAVPGCTALPGALLIGALWDGGGPTRAFAVAAALALLAAAAFAWRAPRLPPAGAGA